MFLQEKGWKDKCLNAIKRPWLILFILYLAFIITSTLFSRSITNPYKSVFSDFGVMVNGNVNKEFLENVLLFIPYSFLYLQAFRPKSSMKNALVVSALTTVFVEISQLVLWLGEFQISDLVHNCIGGLIGIGAWSIINSRSKT